LSNIVGGDVFIYDCEIQKIKQITDGVRKGD